MWTEPLYTAEEMRAAEEAHDGPMIELMERAGSAAAEAVLRRYPDAKSVAVWCGTGSNGGDGFVVARKLHEAGRTVEIVLAGSEEKVAGDAAENLERARKLKIPFVEPGGGDVAVDALFGTGFSGKPRDDAARTIEELNGLGVPILSVDVPSGVDASTGQVAGAAVKADATVTFHGRKVGLVVAPGSVPRRRGRSGRHRAPSGLGRGTSTSPSRSSRRFRAAGPPTTSTRPAPCSSSAARPGRPARRA